MELFVEELAQFESSAVVFLTFTLPTVFNTLFSSALAFMLGIVTGSIQLPVTDPIQQEALINDFLSSFERCVPQLNETIAAGVTESAVELYTTGVGLVPVSV